MGGFVKEMTELKGPDSGLPTGFLVHHCVLGRGVPMTLIPKADITSKGSGKPWFVFVLMNTDV